MTNKTLMTTTQSEELGTGSVSFQITNLSISANVGHEIVCLCHSNNMSNIAPAIEQCEVDLADSTFMHVAPLAALEFQ